jgi:hypothetical protein
MTASSTFVNTPDGSNLAGNTGHIYNLTTRESHILDYMIHQS